MEGEVVGACSLPLVVPADISTKQRECEGLGFPLIEGQVLGACHQWCLQNCINNKVCKSLGLVACHRYCSHNLQCRHQHPHKCHQHTRKKPHHCSPAPAGSDGRTCCTIASQVLPPYTNIHTRLTIALLLQGVMEERAAQSPHKSCHHTQNTHKPHHCSHAPAGSEGRTCSARC